MATRLEYANQNATRNQPLDAKLVSILQVAATTTDGVSDVRVISGGQPSSGPNRTGSHRHDQGNAADIKLIGTDGKPINMNTTAGRDIFAAFITTAVGLGAQGVGAGQGYMGNETIHVGFGNAAAWGAGGHVANAPQWLTDAWNAGLAMTPEDVARARLADLGYTGKDAVTAYQKANGLTVDGIVGPQTLAAIAADTTPSASIPDPYNLTGLVNAVRANDVAGVTKATQDVFSQVESAVKGGTNPKQIATDFQNYLASLTPAQQADIRANLDASPELQAAIRSDTGNPLVDGIKNKMLQPVVSQALQKSRDLATSLLNGGTPTGMANQADVNAAYAAAAKVVPPIPQQRPDVLNNGPTSSSGKTMANPPIPPLRQNGQQQTVPSWIPGAAAKAATTVPADQAANEAFLQQQIADMRARGVSNDYIKLYEQEFRQQTGLPSTGTTTAPAKSTPLPAPSGNDTGGSDFQSAPLSYPDVIARALSAASPIVVPQGTVGQRALGVGTPLTSRDIVGSILPSTPLGIAGNDPNAYNYLLYGTPANAGFASPQPAAPKSVATPKPVLPAANSGFVDDLSQPAGASHSAGATMANPPTPVLSPLDNGGSSGGYSAPSGSQSVSGGGTVTYNDMGDRVLTYEVNGNTIQSVTDSSGNTTSSVVDSSGSDSASTGSVLCTYFYKKGWLSRHLWVADGRFARTLSMRVRRGYWRWAIPTVRRLQRGAPILEAVLWPVVKGWAEYAAWRVGRAPRRSRLGAVVHHVLGPMSWVLGHD